MKKTTTLSALILCCLFTSAIVEAGKTKGKVVSLGPKSPMVSFSLNGNGGTSMSSGVSNAFSFNPTVGVEVGWGNFGLGIDASTFNTKSNFDFDAYAAPLKSVDFLTVTGSNSNWKSTSITFGPSYTFRLVKTIPSIGIVVKHNRTFATVTFSLKGGITMNEAPDNFSVMNNLTRKPIASYSAPSDFQKNAFTLKPSVSFSYWLSQNIALSANVQYAMQTGQTAFTTGYKDLTNVSLAPPLSPDQFTKNISTAPTITTTTVGPDKYLSAGVGITYRFGKKGWDGSIKGNRKGINEGGLKKNENIAIPTDAIAITPNFAVGKHYITIPHDLQNRKENTVSSTNPTGKKFNPNENTGGPSNQVFGYEEAASLELCIQFLDAQGSETDYGSGVCFINTILCPDDVGAITNGGSHVYVPAISEKLNGLPINVLLLTTTKNGKSLNGKEFNLKTDVELSADVAESLNCEKVSIKAGEYKYNEFNAVEIPLNMVARKGWDGSVKGNKIAIKEQGVKKNESERKGIRENGLKKNESEYVLTDAEVKAIAETLVTMRKGWDGSIKGNIAEKKGIKENGLKKTEVKSENTNLDLTSTAQTLVNLARKGWDGSIKGGSIDNKADLLTVTETLENIRKGWDGSIKGNKTEYVANSADVKAIAETLVSLRKGWDGSIKGNKRGRTYTGGRKNDIEEKGINENGLATDDNLTASIDEKRVIWGMGGNVDNNKINNINNNMPNRISMNLTVGKQTQGATFGEKVNAGKINVTLVEGGCIVLFPDNGFRVNTKAKTITALSTNEHSNFGEKVNAGLHAAGGALAQGASLLGGALPGGAIISAAVSSVGSLAGGAGGGAAAASYAKTAEKKKKIWTSDGKDDDCDGLKDLPDGEYELEFVVEEKTPTKSKKEQTQVIIEFSSISNVLKTKHDTAKNSVGNIR